MLGMKNEKSVIFLSNVTFCVVLWSENITISRNVPACINETAFLFI